MSLETINNGDNAFVNGESSTATPCWRTVDAEAEGVPQLRSQELSEVAIFKPGGGQKIPSHASPTAYEFSF